MQYARVPYFGVACSDPVTYNMRTHVILRKIYPRIIAIKPGIIIPQIIGIFSRCRKKHLTSSLENVTGMERNVSGLRF